MSDAEHTEVSNAAFAEGFAPLFDVVQRGVRRRATPADLLELVEPKFVLKRGPLYLGRKGWKERRRGALVINDAAAARAAREDIRKDYGVTVKVVRVRRRGTTGIEGYALREGLKVTDGEQFLGLGVNPAEAMTMLAALTGGAKRSGEA